MKVSIITPSFNQGKFIERTLQSVASQAGADIEHVVFDGGSTDNTIKVLKSFNSSIRWVSERDKGQAHAVNKGIRATGGEIIGWLNSDDIYYPNAVNCVVEFFKKHPEADIVYGMADHIDLNDKPFEPYPTESWDFERLKEVCFICQPALFFRRSIIEKHGLLDDSLRYCMDYEYWLRLGKAGVKFSYIKEKLAGSRLYFENKTLGARAKVHREINNMLNKKFGKVPDKWLFAYAHTLVEPYPNSRKRSFWVVFKIGLYSFLAALRWNGKISFNMISCVRKWILKRA